MLDSTGLLSDDQFHTLKTICQTLTPLRKNDDANSIHEIASLVVAPVAAVGSEQDQRDFRKALTFFESRLLNLFLAGKFQGFSDLSNPAREQVLRAWATSRFGKLRSGFQTFKRLVLSRCYARLEETSGTNAHWSAIQYPGPVTAPNDVAKPIEPLSITKESVVDADVVVIGSGAGGGVVTSELAAAGYKVMVVEKGGYHNEADFDGAELRSLQRLYEKRGILTTRDVSVVLLAGSTLGGGTTINWTTSLRTPDYVLQEWADQWGINAAAGAEWQKSLDAVCARSHVTAEESAPNRQDQKLIAGCNQLHLDWRVIPRNVMGCKDCGYCCFGCQFGAKQGVMKTYLQDAFDHGAQIIVDCHVDRITIRNGTATGVEATVKGHRLNIRSKMVVAAGGSIHTPAILKRSGLQNPNIGRHLHLHPVAAVHGIYDEVIAPWTGTMQSVVCDKFANLDRGYGFVIEVAPAHPGILAFALPWRSRQAHHELMRQAAHMATFIVIPRDRDSGTVSCDGRGRPVLDYTISAYDARHLIEGAQTAVRIHAAAGAHTIGGPYQNLPEISPRAGDNVETFVRRFPQLGVIKNDLTLFSAHQMSSCRMGGNYRSSPVNPDGETYEVRNLFVADGSALPSATGVNPMISIMALAHRNAQVMKTRL
jgi:choline dehydrogenase-like flavoprotein